MSAPETKARPPAPLTTMTRIASSRSKSSMICVTASHISSETALCRAGLLKIRRPIPPSFSAIILLVNGWSSMSGSLLVGGRSRLLLDCGRRCGASHPPIRAADLAAGDRQPSDPRQLADRAVWPDPIGHDDGEQQQPD